jgi:hypothetical protein
MSNKIKVSLKKVKTGYVLAGVSVVALLIILLTRKSDKTL